MVISATILLSLVVVLGNRLQPQSVCSAIEYDITDSDVRQYVSECELSELLQQHNAFPVGTALDKISLQQIEDIVLTHPMVRQAECYATPQSVVCVRVSQRVPLVRIITTNESYFIDTDRKRMPVRQSVNTPVLTATGCIGMQLGAGQIADFAEWLQKDAYWSERIKYIQVRDPNRIYIVQKDKDAATIVLGNMDDFVAKLHKLKLYYENGGAMLCNDRHYSELDVRFRGQVIGRK